MPFTDSFYVASAVPFLSMGTLNLSFAPMFPVGSDVAAQGPPTALR